MTLPLVIAGGGGFGRVLVSISRVHAVAGGRWEIQGVVDDAISEVNRARLERLGLPHPGGVDVLLALRPVAVGVGKNPARRRLVESLWNGIDFPVLAHSDPTVGGDVVLDTALIGAGATVLIGVCGGAKAVVGCRRRRGRKRCAGFDPQGGAGSMRTAHPRGHERINVVAASPFLVPHEC